MTRAAAQACARSRAVVGRWAHTPTRTRGGGRCRLLGVGKQKVQSVVGVSKIRKNGRDCTARREGSPAHQLFLSPLAAGWCTFIHMGLRPSVGRPGGGRTQCASHPRPTETRARSRGSAHTGGRLSFGRLASSGVTPVGLLERYEDTSSPLSHRFVGCCGS